MRSRRLAVVILAAGTCAVAATAPRAEAFNPIKPVCTVGGLVSGLVGKACTLAEHGGRLLSAGRKLASGHLGGAVKTVLGEGGSSIGPKATFALGLAAVVTWVLGGAKYVLHVTASVIGHTTAPQLRGTWFSATYWRVAGIAALLTLPFLFAAAIQALIQSDITLLARAALGYLPLAVLGVSIAAPLTMLLLAATDQMSAIVSSAAGNASAQFLNRAAGAIGGLTLMARSPFLVFFVGLLTVGGAIVLWLELLLRAAAVYVIVLMLPLAFAALVWPARRMWAIRAVELLIALILSKFLIVAVLSLGGAAFSESFLSSVSGTLAGLVLLVLGALAPWALLRLLPLGELASGAAGSLRAETVRAGIRLWSTADGGGRSAEEWAVTTAEMRRDAEDLSSAEDRDHVLTSPIERSPNAETPADGRVTAPDSAGEHVADTRRGAVPDSGGGEERPTSSRSPGLGPVWQMEDFSWPVLTLGLEDGWPPGPLQDQIGDGQQHAAADGNGNRPADAVAPSDPGELDRVAAPQEDHDPTPPPQPPEGGTL